MRRGGGGRRVCEEGRGGEGYVRRGGEEKGM